MQFMPPGERKGAVGFGLRGGGVFWRHTVYPTLHGEFNLRFGFWDHGFPVSTLPPIYMLCKRLCDRTGRGGLRRIWTVQLLSP